MDDLRPSIMIIPYVGKGNVFSGRRLKILIPPNSKANNIHYETDCPICEDNHRVMFQEVMDGSLVGWK